MVPPVIFVASLGCLMWNLNRPPFDLDLLDQLQPGMTQAEIRRVLGSPSSVYSDSWAYSRYMAWPIVYIRFDDAGRFAESEYDF